MAELKRFGLVRKPENYAFFDPESKLHLTLSKPVGSVPLVTKGIERGLKTGKIMDMDAKVQTKGVVLADPMEATKRAAVLEDLNKDKDQLPPVGGENPNEEGTDVEDPNEEAGQEVEGQESEGSEGAEADENTAPEMKYSAETIPDDYDQLKALAKEEGIKEKAKAKIVEALLQIQA
ncbi:MAG: hypothetical protein ACQ5SW_00350 [Sphaerochaetaceae bacterium]